MAVRLTSTFKNYKTYLILLIVNLFSAALAFLIYKLIAIKYSSNNLYLFTYIKKIISFLVPISLLGLGVALTRNVANDRSKAESFLLVSIFCTTILPLIISFFYWCFPEFIIKTIFGKVDYTYDAIMVPTIMNTIGLIMISLLISYYRGMGQYILASLTNLIFLSLIPILLLFLLTTLEDYIFWLGLVLIISGLIFLLNVYLNKKIIKIDLKNYLSEGLYRLVGDISYYFLVFLPSYVVMNYMNNLAVGAAIAFSQVLINSVVILINPISFVILPKSASQVKSNKKKELRRDFLRVSKLVFIFFSIMLCLFLYSLDYIIIKFYTKNVLDNIDLLKLILFVLPFFALHSVGRNYVDGMSKQPFMSMINFIGLVVFFGLNIINNWSLGSLPVAYILSFVVMDIMIFILVLNRKICS